MVNRIIPNPDLAHVDYTDLLNKTLQTLQQKKIFEIRHNQQWLLIQINKIATQIAKSQVNNPLGNSTAVHTATLNLSPGSEERFRQRIREITQIIQQQITAAIAQNTNIDKVTFIKQLITDLNKFTGKPDKFDLTYNFPKISELQKQRLTFKQNNNQNRQLLKAHKIKISVNKPRNFHQNLLAGINNFIEQKFADASTEDRE